MEIRRAAAVLLKQAVSKPSGHPTLQLSRNLKNFRPGVFGELKLMKRSELNLKNRVDYGPDVVCAEWVVESGGKIKWVGSDTFIDRTSKLPRFRQFIRRNSQCKLEDINLDGATILVLGMEHLEWLDHVKKITLHGCRGIDDTAIEKLREVEHTLEHLELSNITNIMDGGLKNVAYLRNLKYLKVYDMPRVLNPADCKAYLEAQLPKCKVDFTNQDGRPWP